MTRICAWLFNQLSQLLEPDERDAVRGDLTESSETGWPALGELLGLVVRRQAALWKEWRPWVALVGLAVPIGFQISLSSLQFDSTYDLYRWIIRNHHDIDPSILNDIGMSVPHGIAQMATQALLLIAWCSICSFVLASLSPRTIWVNGSLFCFTLLCGKFFFLALNRPHRYDNTGTAFSLFLFGVMLPIAFHIVFLFLPAESGKFGQWRCRATLAPGWQGTILPGTRWSDVSPDGCAAPARPAAVF